MLFKVSFIAALLPAAFACFEGHNLDTRRIHARQVGGPVTPRYPDVYDWNYEDQDWAAIQPAYEICSTGTRQSPIALSASQGYATTHQPDFSANPVTQFRGQFYNGGHGVYFTLNHADGICTSLPTMNFDGETVYLIGWHTHTPAEHTVDGTRPRAELHFVWVTDAGAPRAVVGFHVQTGTATSTFFAQYPTPWPDLDSQDSQVELGFDFVRFTDEAAGLPRYWTYEGSLTTPACAEDGLRWFFSADAFAADAAQLAEIERVGPFSARNLNAIADHNVNL